MPRRAEKREHSVDWLGGALLAAGTCALLLGLVWGGEQYPWTLDAGARRTLAVRRRCSALFALVERRVPEPILPFDLMRNRRP